MDIDEVMIRNYLDKMTFTNECAGTSYQRIIGRHSDLPEITAEISLINSSPESFRYHVGISSGDSGIQFINFYENFKDPEIAEDLEYLCSLDKSEDNGHILSDKLAKDLFFKYAIPELEKSAKEEMDFSFDISQKLSKISGTYVSAAFTPIDLVNIFPYMRHTPLSYDSQACISKFEDLKLNCYYRNDDMNNFKVEKLMGLHTESYLASFEYFGKPLKIYNYSITTKDGESEVSGDHIMKDIFNTLIIPKMNELQEELEKSRNRKTLACKIRDFFS